MAKDDLRKFVASLTPDEIVYLLYAKNFAGCKTPPSKAKFLHPKNAVIDAFL